METTSQRLEENESWSNDATGSCKPVPWPALRAALLMDLELE
jgi:hypothetical protein